MESSVYAPKCLSTQVSICFGGFDLVEIRASGFVDLRYSFAVFRVVRGQGVKKTRHAPLRVEKTRHVPLHVSGRITRGIAVFFMLTDMGGLVGRVIANGTTFPYVKFLVPQTHFLDLISVNFGENFCVVGQKVQEELWMRKNIKGCGMNFLRCYLSNLILGWLMSVGREKNMFGTSNGHSFFILLKISEVSSMFGLQTG